jgi:hypothetical protein
VAERYPKGLYVINSNVTDIPRDTFWECASLKTLMVRSRKTVGFKFKGSTSIKMPRSMKVHGRVSFTGFTTVTNNFCGQAKQAWGDSNIANTREYCENFNVNYGDSPGGFDDMIPVRR